MSKYIIQTIDGTRHEVEADNPSYAMVKMCLTKDYGLSNITSIHQADPLTEKSSDEARRICEKIFYSPATNNQAEQSIKDGTEAILRFAVNHLPDAGKGIEELKRFISDDAAAITYQSLGQYRSALLKMIKEQPEFQHSPKQCLCPFEGHTRECDKCDKRTTTP